MSAWEPCSPRSRPPAWSEKHYGAEHRHPVQRTATPKPRPTPSPRRARTAFGKSGGVLDLTDQRDCSEIGLLAAGGRGAEIF